MNINKENIALLKEANKLCENIRQNLPNVADPAAVSIESKIPFKVLSIRELMLWRISDISDSAHELYKNEEIVSAIILTRSVMESVSVLFVLLEKLEKALEEDSIERLDDDVMRLLLGGRLEDSYFQSFNIITLIDKLDKWSNGFRKAYDELSEFAHPNWSGCLGSYGKIDEEKFLLELNSKTTGSSY